MTDNAVDKVIVAVLAAYDIPQDGCSVNVLTSGLINKTWRVTAGGKVFILQRINHLVFKQPQHVADNIRMIADYLAQYDSRYVFTAPVKTTDDVDMIHDPQSGYYRLFPYIHGSHTIDVVQSPEQAFEAAKQFGTFTKMLAGFDATRLQTTIPDFHNLTFRYRQFEHALEHGNKDRIKESAHLIKVIQHHRDLLETFKALSHNPDIRKRVTHHDTKISNVLFDHNNKGICVIDLDTVMPGYFISDVGDMMRTYLSPANEEEKDFSKIEIRDDFFRAIVQGYVGSMQSELTRDETNLILYSGSFLIYMQAVRFLADYFNNDTYYGIHYPEQNFVRTGNQLALLKAMEEKKKKLQEIISQELKS